MGSMGRAWKAFGVAAFTALAGCGSSAVPSTGADVAGAGGSGWTTIGTRAQPSRADARTLSSGGSWVDYDPPYLFESSIAQNNALVTMDDGVGISVNVTRPASAAGQPSTAPLPTIVTFTPYNKNTNNVIPLGGGVDDYLVRHGYNHVVIDVRGTGRSGGAWDPFSAREQQDYAQVIDWVLQQPWCNGVIGAWGISATATTAMLAAGKHPAVKAAFPIVPHGDIYRDVVFVGGQASVGFLPIWMSIVEMLATLNPSFYDQPAQYVQAVTEHVLGVNDFLIYRTSGVLLGGADSAYDNQYWADKNPLEVAQNLKVPTFITGGLFDIFQRSEPLNYESLKNHTTAKLLIGPWNHLQAATGEGLPLEGVPVLDHVALQWFDRYLKNMPSGAENLPNVTQWVWGEEHFETAADWPHPQARALRLYLQPGGGLAPAMPAAGGAPTMVVQQPFNGICSESSMQISIGLFAYAPLPCWYEDNLVQGLEAVFETQPLTEDVYINGPMQADIYLSTTALNAGVVVRVSDVDEGGTAHSRSSGLLTASLRAVDETKSRYLDGQMIQPWHPFTQDSVQSVGIGNVVKAPVEIFHSAMLIRQGHRLRVSVGASNFPFAAMPAPDLALSVAGLLSVYSDAEHPSSVVLPVVPVAVLRNR